MNYAGTHETPETKVAAVVDIYGPVDYEKIARQRQAYPNRFNMTSINGHQKNGGSIWFFGAKGYDEESYAKLKAVSPLFAVHEGMPPFLAIHGTRDDQVPYEQSTMMCEAMRKVGARCDIVTVEAGGHGMGGWKDADQQHYKADMIAWLKATLTLQSAVPLRLARPCKFGTENRARGSRQTRSLRRWLEPRCDPFRSLGGGDHRMDLEFDEVAPASHPFLQQPGIVRFHELIATLERRVHPAGDVRQPFRRKSSLIPEAPIDREGVAALEVLDHHVERLGHRGVPDVCVGSCVRRSGR